MWTAIAAFAMQIIEWIFGGKQQAQGEAQGKAEQALSDENQEMKNESKAQSARAGVNPDVAGVLDGSDNAGPATR